MCDELVAVAGAVRRDALGVVAGRRREVCFGEEEADGVRGVSPSLVDAPDREVVERDADRRTFAAFRTKREIGPRAGPSDRQREGDFNPTVTLDRKRVLQDAVERT